MLKSLMMAVALVSSSSAFAAEGSLRCGGTEPFWNLTIDAMEMTYTPMGYSPVAYEFAAPRQAAGRPDGYAFVYRSKQKGPGPRNELGTITAIVKRGECSDHMSENKYEYFVTMYATFGDSMVVHDGCCNVKTVVTP
jgi:uncharacterized membrane protein